MRKLFLSAASAALLATGNMAALTVPASAQVEFEIGPDGVEVRPGCNPRYERCRDRRDRRDFYDDGSRYSGDGYRRGCSEDRALDKASSMGLHRVRIRSVERRTITVRGRDDYGERVYVTFLRERGCPVLQ